MIGFAKGRIPVGDACSLLRFACKDLKQSTYTHMRGCTVQQAIPRIEFQLELNLVFVRCNGLGFLFGSFAILFGLVAFR
jgi:hypothetical protein